MTYLQIVTFQPHMVNGLEELHNKSLLSSFMEGLACKKTFLHADIHSLAMQWGRQDRATLFILQRSKPEEPTTISHVVLLHIICCGIWQLI